MTCEHAQSLLSAALDDPLDPADAGFLSEHTADCRDCHVFADDLQHLRQRLRLQPVGTVPDIARSVSAELMAPSGRRQSAPSWHGWLQAAAVFVVAALIGATMIGIRGPAPVSAASLGERLLSRQSDISTLAGRLDVVERGWHPDVPVRRFSGSLTYRAPESLAVRLRDTTVYPSARWTSNDVLYVAADDAQLARGLRSCPQALQPSCSGTTATTATSGRAPFDAAVAVPLDLVLPVASLGEHSAPRILGYKTIDGGQSIGVAVTAAQIQPLLAGVTGVGNWRAFHPADGAEVWLDDRSLTLRSVAVYPADDASRRLWAASQHYDDQPGVPILEVTLRDAVTNGRLDTDDLRIPDSTGPTVDAGFREGPAGGVPVPGWLPEGMRPHRRGTQDSRDIATWSDGRAWLRVDATARWNGQRLFGDLGEVVRRVALPNAGVAYAGDGGRTVALHGEHLDVVVTGSLDQMTLQRVADSLGVVGEAVPPSWRESGATTVAAAPAGTVRVPDLPGFSEPAVHVEGDTVTLSLAGPGARGFVVVQRPATVLSPPLDAHVMGVSVRGQDGRYTLDRGELEWVENGNVLVVRSETMGLRELLAVATRLELSS